MDNNLNYSVAEKKDPRNPEKEDITKVRPTFKEGRKLKEGIAMVHFKKVE